MQKEWSRKEHYGSEHSQNGIEKGKKGAYSPAGTARMTDVSHCRDNIPSVSWLMQARGRKGRGRCKLGTRDRLAIQKKRLHGAGRIMATRADDFFRGKPRHGVATTGLFLSLFHSFSWENASMRRGKHKGHVIRSGLDADWTEVGIEHRHLALSSARLHFSMREAEEQCSLKIIRYRITCPLNYQTSHVFFRKQVYHRLYFIFTIT